MSTREFVKSNIDGVSMEVIEIIASIIKLNQTPEKKQRKAGGLKGKIWLAENFDEEMDEYGRFASEPDFGTPVKEVWDN